MAEWEYVGPLPGADWERIASADVQEEEGSGFFGRVMQRIGTGLAQTPGLVTGPLKVAPALQDPIGTMLGTGEMARATRERAGRGAMETLAGFGGAFEPLVAPIGEAARGVGHAYAAGLADPATNKVTISPGLEGMPLSTELTPTEFADISALGAEVGLSPLPYTRALGIANKTLVPGVLGRKLTPLGNKMLKILGPHRVRVAQITNSPFMDFWDNVAGGSLTGAGVYERQALSTERAIAKMTDDFAEAIGPTVKNQQVMGEALKELADNTDDMWRAAGNRLYKRVDEIMPEPSVNLSGVYRHLQKLANKFPETYDEGKLIRLMMNEMRPMTEKVDQAAKFAADLGMGPAPVARELPNLKTFLDANDLRSYAYSWQRPGLTPAGDQSARIGNEIGGMIDNAIDEAGKIVSPEARKALQSARDWWRSESETFNSRVVRRLLHDPNLASEDVVNTFLKPGALTEVDAFKKALGGAPEDWRIVQRHWVNDLLSKAEKLNTQTGRRGLEGATLLKSLERWGETGERILGKNIRGLWDIAEILTGFQAKTGGGGGMAIKLMQAGPVLGLGGALYGGPVGGAAVAAGATMTVAPWAMAKIFVNPKMTNMLIKGLKAPVGSLKAQRSAAALINFLRRREER